MRACDNPFRVERVLTIRYRISEGEWQDLLARLKQLGWRAALVGPMGSGKTTLLEDLAPRLRALGFTPRTLWLTREKRAFDRAFLDGFFASLSPRDIILFDGAEQLGPLAWRRFKRRARPAGGLVITRHCPGRLPTLRVMRVTPELLEQIVAELAPDDWPTLKPLADELFQKHGGNLRDALRDLYDIYADK